MTDQELYAQYIEKVESLKKDDRFSYMSKDMLNGHNSYLRLKFAGSSIFNPVWIKKIEDCLYELGQIINNPREVTTQEGAVMPVELAKKINYESVQHLASHSQYIKEIKDNGDIVPSKILGIYNKDEIHTYENRFIATFIRRLVIFVEKRYEFIKQTINLNEKEIMFVKNKSVVDGQEVEIETKITVTREKEDDLSMKAREYIARIEGMKQYITYYYNSPFMKEFKTEKDVRKPILMTNIIRKNPLYHKCYETFLFIEKFDSLGVAFKVDRDWKEFNEKERKQLSYILLSNLLFLQHTEDKKPYKKFEKVYKPKLLTSIDDESFLYGDLVKGPIDFVRADESYINYLKELSPKDLPTHPNKVEKEYYKDEYQEKKALRNQVESIEALLARIRRQIAKFEKKVNKLLEERRLEEAAEAQRQLEALREQERSILDQKREEIIRAAKGEDVNPQEPEPAPVVEEPQPEPEPVVEETPVEEPQQEEPAAEETPVEEEQPVEEQPQEEPVPEETPVEEEKAEEQPVEEAQEEEPQPEEPIEEVKEEVPEEQPAESEPEPEPEPEPVAEEPAPEEEPIVEEAPVEEAPQEEPVEEQPAEETPVEEDKVEEQPEEVPEEPKEEPKKKARRKKKRTRKAKPAPVEESQPEEAKEEPAPVLDEPQEEEPVVEKPQPEEPVEETPAEEPVEEQPVEEKKAKPKKRRKKRKKAAKVAPIEEKPAEQEPVQEEPQPEPEPEPQPEPEPEPEPVPVVEEPAKEEPKKKAPRKKKAPKAKVAPAPAPKKKAKPAKKKPAPKKEKEPEPIIPGRFIVKTAEGYYVNQKRTSIMKSDAHVFNDFNAANKIKAKMGGKVVKL